jgi:hypothetical protein
MPAVAEEMSRAELAGGRMRQAAALIAALMRLAEVSTAVCIV